MALFRRVLNTVFNLLIFPLIIYTPAKAQVDSTVVRFYIPSYYFIIRTNDRLYESRKIVKLPQGLQRIQIYTPEFELIDTLLIVEDAPDGQMVMPSFRINEEFDRYQRQLKEYRDRNFIELGIPLITSTFAVGYALYYFNRANLSYDNAAWYYRKWLGANLNERQTYLDEFLRHEADYKRYRAMNYITLAVAGVSTAFTVRGYLRYRKRKVPTFRIPPVPFSEYYLRFEPLTYDLLYPGIRIIVPF
ncbi:hypothetical protein JCM31826_15170 [Thermaurantimonas aggregans]|uniref:PEGA domain-containing protein n=1 Tax=Thermaurantimonas aggregans TaxID=2173829 RepID=A0A401XLY5_9FLAO|nr:hypothetical protein [Thermaurantimonas aggregans]GCD78035.1 hypothetical protein JCM31826_15170 [Thermaurantimonas aggregans]